MHRDAGGEVLHQELEVAGVARQVRAADGLQRGEAVAARDDNGLAGLRVVTARIRDVGADFGHHRRQLDAVGAVRPAVAEVVGDFDGELAVLREREAHFAVRAATVVVAGEHLAVGVADGEHGVELRADAAGIDVDVEGLALLGVEAEPVHVALLADDAVEGEREFTGRDGHLLHVVVRFLLQHVGEGRDANRVEARRDKSLAFREHAELELAQLW